MKKRSRFVALSLVILLLFSGCELFGGQEKPVVRREITSPELSRAATTELVVWAGSQTSMLALKFNALHPELQVKVYDPSQLFGRRILPMSLADGTGGFEYPDIIEVSSLFTAWGEEDCFEDVYKMMDAGVFLDLTELVEQDLDLEQYDPAAFQGCAYRGGRYLVPASMSSSMMTLVADHAALEELGFDLQALKDAPAFLTELARVREQGGVKSALSQMDERGLSLKSAVFAACDPRLLNYEAGTVLEDGESFQRFCEAWKAFFYDGGGEPENPWQPRTALQKLEERESLFVLNQELNCTLASGLKQGGAPFVAGFPNTEEGVTGDLIALGICARGKNHQNAWKFIQYMLSQEAQTADQSTLPVLLDAREARIQAEFEKNGELDEAYRLTEEEKQMLSHAASGYTAARVASPALFSLFESNMGPYFTGKAGYSACEEDLRAALRDYLAA